MGTDSDTQRLLKAFLDWLAAGRTFVEFRERYPEISERDIGVALHALPTPVVFARPTTPYMKVGAPALAERLAGLCGIFKDPLSKNRLTAECALVDEWAVELFFVLSPEPAVRPAILGHAERG